MNGIEIHTLIAEINDKNACIHACALTCHISALHDYLPPNHCFCWSPFVFSTLLRNLWLCATSCCSVPFCSLPNRRPKPCSSLFTCCHCRRHCHFFCCCHPDTEIWSAIRCRPICRCCLLLLLSYLPNQSLAILPMEYLLNGISIWKLC